MTLFRGDPAWRGNERRRRCAASEAFWIAVAVVVCLLVWIGWRSA